MKFKKILENIGAIKSDKVKSNLERRIDRKIRAIEKTGQPSLFLADLIHKLPEDKQQKYKSKVMKAYESKVKEFIKEIEEGGEPYNSRRYIERSIECLPEGKQKEYQTQLEKAYEAGKEKAVDYYLDMMERGNLGLVKKKASEMIENELSKNKRPKYREKLKEASVKGREKNK